MQTPTFQPETTDPQSGTRGRWMVVIHNNHTNSFDEVIVALMAGTGCDIEEASIEAWEAHHYGKAPVHFAAQAECVEAAATISRVGVVTDVLPEWND